ncbi:MAG TPA: PilN domain-containing protein [Terriglobales bacterium]|nr:PilN domain-containing protein [Terriglobales bacterium]HKW67858.1 PilN domain-containing protein [Terriglobales bacterium]
MIRINLLGVPKSKSKRGPSLAAVVPGAGVSVVMKVLLVFALAAAMNFGYWYHLNAEKARLATQLVQAERKNRELSEVKAKYLEREKQMQQYKRRVDVIDELRSQQFGPVKLMATLGGTVDNTEAVWLSVVRDQGSSIDIEGRALSENAVANLITNLQKTGYFKTVEMKESYQDEQVKNMQAFVFTITCQKAKS